MRRNFYTKLFSIIRVCLLQAKQAQAVKLPALAQRSFFKCCRFEYSALTHSILIFEKNGADEKSLIFMHQIDIWSEPTRPWRSFAAHFSETMIGGGLKNLQLIDTLYKIYVLIFQPKISKSFEMAAFLQKSKFLCFLSITFDILGILKIWKRHVKELKKLN